MQILRKVSQVHMPSLVSTHQSVTEICPYLLFGGFTADFDWLSQTNGLEKSTIHLITFVRLSPKIICAKFCEDCTNFEACEIFLSLLRWRQLGWHEKLLCLCFGASHGITRYGNQVMNLCLIAVPLK